jgi:acetyltransferase-like isoleucine patch superfamily enzyme
MLRARRANLAARVRRRLQTGGVWGHLLGLLLRGRIQKAGIIVVKGGWPLPSIDNDGGRIEIGNCALWSGVRLEVWRGARLTIGTGTYLNRNTEVVVAHAVTIGRDCKIARDVLIMDTDQHPLPGGDLIASPVVIEDGVWVGARSIILKGVRIGHDSVIGAGAIVTKSVPPHSVVVGTAARVIRSLTPVDAPNP